MQVTGEGAILRQGAAGEGVKLSSKVERSIPPSRTAINLNTEQDLCLRSKNFYFFLGKFKDVLVEEN